MLAVAILAAGKGTRMNSSKPKVLHELCGKSLIKRVIDSCKELNPDRTFIVVGHRAMEVEQSLSGCYDELKIQYVLQEPQNGTGHAIQVLSKELLDFNGELLVLNGDVPLIKSKTLKELIQSYESNKVDAALLTTKKENPSGYGRIFLKEGYIDRIIEEKDCNDEECKNKLTNAGIYCFRWESLNKIINDLNDKNIQKEIYLTDTISLLKKTISFELQNDEELRGINTRVHLAECEEYIQKKLIKEFMLNGVTFISPSSCTLSEDCIIGRDVVIEANCHLRGKTVISDNCTIGPNTFIKNSIIGEKSVIVNSSLFDSEIMRNVSIGPYSHIRPGSKICSDCKVGNFVEIKKSFIDESTKINHLSYVGDSSIGRSTNLGAGSITANFDGTKKNKTIIGNNCSIGSNTVLIAPIKIGNSVTIGAGSVINKNVMDNSLAISRPKQINIANWKKSNN